jgi:hypothetical protein
VLAEPSRRRDHLLGQDKLGRDILARHLRHARLARIGVITVVVSLIIGASIGAVADLPAAGSTTRDARRRRAAFPGPFARDPSPACSGEPPGVVIALT